MISRRGAEIRRSFFSRKQSGNRKGRNHSVLFVIKFLQGPESRLFQSEFDQKLVRKFIDEFG